MVWTYRRQWWLTLQTDSARKDWLLGDLEPCLMTLREHDELIGIDFHQVDDMVEARNPSVNKQCKRPVGEIRGLYERKLWRI